MDGQLDVFGKRRHGECINVLILIFLRLLNKILVDSYNCLPSDSCNDDPPRNITKGTEGDR